MMIVGCRASHGQLQVREMGDLVVIAEDTDS
jgi:hypothetical protein